MIATRPYILTALLFDALELEGWKFGTGQQLRVQELLRQLPADISDEALGLALAPLLARNPQEQETVYEKLRECQKRADEMGVLVAPTATAPDGTSGELPTRNAYWKTWLPLALLTLAVLGIGIWFKTIKNSRNFVQLHKEVVVYKGETLHFCPEDFPTSDSLPGALNSVGINFSRAMLTQEDVRRLRSKSEGDLPSDAISESALGSFFVGADTCLHYATKDSLGQDSLVLALGYADGKKAELHLKIYVAKTSAAPPPDTPKVESPAPLFSRKPLPYPHDIRTLVPPPLTPWVASLAAWWPWLRWVLLGLLAAALYAAWLYWWRKRQKLIAELRNRDKPPYVWNIKIPGSDDIVLGDDFGHVLQLLRRRAGADAWRLDLKATIAATSERGGMPEFRYQQQTRPVDYLLLIDRQSLYNHRAQLYDALFRAFREQEIVIARFFYDSDLRLCHNEEHPSGLRLTEIAQRYGEARLIVVGTGAQVISPVSGQVEKWGSVLQNWSESALLTPKPPGEWGRNERRLGEVFSAVLPASLQSLAFWVEELEDGDEARFDEWREQVKDIPAAFWQPDPAVPLPFLQLQYNDRQLRWVAACAIYPALHYDLTLWLGKQVYAAQHSGAETGSKNSSAELEISDLSALFRLRWFVDGQIPQTARAALLEWLQQEDPELLGQLRLSLTELLRQNPPPKDSAAFNDHALSVALNEWMATQDPKRRKELEKQIAQLLEAGTEADFVALKYLEQPRSPLDFPVPDSWKKYVHPGGMPALGNRMRVLLLLLAGLLGIALLGNLLVSNWLRGQQDRCPGYLEEYTWHPQATKDLMETGVDSTGLPKPGEVLSTCIKNAGDIFCYTERVALDTIAAGALVPFDSISRWYMNLYPLQAFDSLRRVSFQNIATALYNKGVAYYLREQRDSACWWFGKAMEYDSTGDFANAAAWCNTLRPDKAAAVQVLGPIGFNVVDAETRIILKNAFVSAPELPVRAFNKAKNGRFTLTLPKGWIYPYVTLQVKALGYLDTTFSLKVDKVREFPPLKLRKSIKGNWILNGSVVDAANGRAIPGVSLMVIGGPPPAFTNALGNFSLNYPYPTGTGTKVYMFKFEKPGFEPEAYCQLRVERGYPPQFYVSNQALLAHQVQKGETASGIAQKYALATEELLEQNNLPDPDALNVGQILYLRSYEKTLREPYVLKLKKKMAGKEHKVIETDPKQVFYKEHIVAEGETLKSIAAKYKCNINELAIVNGFSVNDAFTPGSRLLIPMEESKPSTPLDPQQTPPPMLPEMVPVAGGTFTMGSDDKDAEKDECPHQETVADFSIGKYEVTVAEYLAFADATKSHYPEWLEAGNAYHVETGTDKFYAGKGYSRTAKNLPVCGVSWDDAVAYCAWLSQLTGEKYRLPLEKEWEYAAKGGQKSGNYRYAGSNSIDKVAWYDDNSGSKPHPVGGKAANELGIFDMSGNLWEWCQDKWAPYPGCTAAECSDCAVLRGGSWYGSVTDCRSALRDGDWTYIRGNYDGFRCARDGK